MRNDLGSWKTVSVLAAGLVVSLTTAHAADRGRAALRAPAAPAGPSSPGSTVCPPPTVACTIDECTPFVRGQGAPTQLGYFNCDNGLASDPLLYWDPTTQSLGVNTSTAARNLHVVGNARIDASGATSGLQVTQSDATQPAVFAVNTGAAGAGTGNGITAQTSQTGGRAVTGIQTEAGAAAGQAFAILGVVNGPDVGGFGRAVVGQTFQSRGRGVFGRNDAPIPNIGNGVGVYGQTLRPIYCPADESVVVHCSVTTGQTCSIDFDCPTGETCIGECPSGGTNTPVLSRAIQGTSFAFNGLGGLFIGTAADGAYIETEGNGIAASGHYFGGLFSTMGTDLDAGQSFPFSAAVETINIGSSNLTYVNFWDGVAPYKIIGTGLVSTMVMNPATHHKVTMFAPEAPEPLFNDFGQGQLVNGVAHITIDPVLAHNIVVDATHPLRIFIQLEDNANCKGVVVAKKDVSGFDVIELQGGRSNTPFSYQITANRRNEVLDNGKTADYESLRFPNSPNGWNHVRKIEAEQPEP